MVRQNDVATRSPLRQPPLRNPGQSLEREIQRLADEQALPHYMGAVTIVVFAAYEWWRFAFSAPPRPIHVTVAAVVVVGYSLFKLLRLRRKLQQLWLGLDGEKVVAQHLEQLRRDGYDVFHDVPGHGFNVDHVIVGPAGVFAVETKTYRKPVGRDAHVTFDGERVLVDGHAPDRDPLVQARAQSKWVAELLFKTTGHQYRVRGVVLFPGWYVDRVGSVRCEEWVLSPNAFPKWLANESSAMAPEDQALISDRLAIHVRQAED